MNNEISPLIAITQLLKATVNHTFKVSKCSKHEPDHKVRPTNNNRKAGINSFMKDFIDCLNASRYMTK